jgi:hypothetical protein
MKILLSLLKFSTPFYNVVEPEEYYLLCHEAVWSGVSIPTFRRHVLHPHSGTKSKPNMRQAEPSIFYLQVFLTCSSSLKVDAVLSAETPDYTAPHLHIHDGRKLDPASLDRIYIFGHLPVLTQKTGGDDRAAVPPPGTQSTMNRRCGLRGMPKTAQWRSVQR